MNFGLATQYNEMDFEQLNADEIEVVSGGSGVAGSIAMGTAIGWSGFVMSVGVGSVVNGMRGAIVGGLAGFAVGAVAGAGYAIATNYG